VCELLRHSQLQHVPISKGNDAWGEMWVLVQHMWFMLITGYTCSAWGLLVVGAPGNRLGQTTLVIRAEGLDILGKGYNSVCEGQRRIGV
jgi:hypothetical protein